MKCPQCNNEFPLTWKLYFKTTFGRFTCPNCKTKLISTHRWFYHPLALSLALYCCILGIPLAIIGAFVYGPTGCFIGFIVGSLAVVIPVDRLFEMQFSILKIRKNNASSKTITEDNSSPTIQQKDVLSKKAKLSLSCFLIIPILLAVVMFIWAVNMDSQSSKYAYILQKYILNRKISPPANYSGLWVTWSPKGFVGSEAQYMNGLLHGKRLYYGRNGNKWSELNFVKGKIHGASKRWYPNKQLQRESMCQNGKLNGQVKSWTESGELIATGEHKEGERFEGTFARFNSDHKITRILEYKDGKMINEKIIPNTTVDVERYAEE
jgi:MORN repeat protein